MRSTERRLLQGEESPSGAECDLGFSVKMLCLSSMKEAGRRLEGLEEDAGGRMVDGSAVWTLVKHLVRQPEAP